MTYTHYDYLDLAPGAEPCADRGRVRSGARAIPVRRHATPGQDLSGLVRMIHAAYDVLSSPESRRSYDAQLAREAADADAELKTTLDARPAEGTRLVQDVPAALRSRSRRSQHERATGSTVYGRRESNFFQTANSDAVGGRIPLPVPNAHAHDGTHVECRAQRAARRTACEGARRRRRWADCIPSPVRGSRRRPDGAQRTAQASAGDRGEPDFAARALH